MLYLVCYDIENDRLRTKAAKKLLSQGLERVQYSVFIGPLSDLNFQKMQTFFDVLFKKVEKYSVLFIPLHEDMIGYIIEHCHEPLDWEYLRGNTETLIL